MLAVYMFWKARKFYTRKPIRRLTALTCLQSFCKARESELKEKRKRMVELGKHWIECALHENTDCDQFRYQKL